MKWEVVWILWDLTLPPARALAKKYLNINCSVMSPNFSRMDYISEMIDDYQIDGVLELVLQACHTYAISARESPERISLPVSLIPWRRGFPIW